MNIKNLIVWQTLIISNNKIGAKVMTLIIHRIIVQLFIVKYLLLFLLLILSIRFLNAAAYDIYLYT